MEPAEAVTGYAEMEAPLRALSVGFDASGCCCGAVVLRLCVVLRLVSCSCPYQLSQKAEYPSNKYVIY